MFESVLGLNVDKIVDLSLAVAEDISATSNGQVSFTTAIILPPAAPRSQQFVDN